MLFANRILYHRADVLGINCVTYKSLTPEPIYLFVLGESISCCVMSRSIVKKRNRKTGKFIVHYACDTLGGGRYMICRYKLRDYIYF